MKVGVKKDTGMVRENNEDCYIVDEEIGLFLVADGVGGHQAGEVASRLGSETIQKIIKTRLIEQGGHDIEGIIKEAIDHAHKEVSNHATTNPDLSGMGTTVVLGLYQNHNFYVAHVGDSRAYLINSQNITPLTEDHSLVTSMIKAGKISEKDARTHRMRHIITQCLGCDQYFAPDIRSFDFNKDDILLICSDGLTDMVEDKEIKKIVLKKRGDIQNCAEELVKLANKKGGLDNITIILVEND